MTRTKKVKAEEVVVEASVEPILEEVAPVKKARKPRAKKALASIPEEKEVEVVEEVKEEVKEEPKKMKGGKVKAKRPISKWIQAVIDWNKKKGGQYVVPRKDTKEYKAVKAIYEKMK